MLLSGVPEKLVHLSEQTASGLSSYAVCNITVPSVVQCNAVAELSVATSTWIYGRLHVPIKKAVMMTKTAKLCAKATLAKSYWGRWNRQDTLSCPCMRLYIIILGGYFLIVHWWSTQSCMMEWLTVGLRLLALFPSIISLAVSQGRMLV